MKLKVERLFGALHISCLDANGNGVIIGQMPIVDYTDQPNLREAAINMIINCLNGVEI